MEMNQEKEKPRIRQAGSAEAFVGSTAAGREHPYNRFISENIQLFSYCVMRLYSIIYEISQNNIQVILNFPHFLELFVNPLDFRIPQSPPRNPILMYARQSRN
jgi:hypothetical protein